VSPDPVTAQVMKTSWFMSGFPSAARSRGYGISNTPSKTSHGWPAAEGDCARRLNMMIDSSYQFN
jgi:hypothetical protein